MLKTTFLPVFSKVWLRRRKYGQNSVFLVLYESAEKLATEQEKLFYDNWLSVYTNETDLNDTEYRLPLKVSGAKIT